MSTVSRATPPGSRGLAVNGTPSDLVVAGSLWTVDEVAQFLGVSPKTVRKWQLAGSLPFVKLGGKLVRFQPEAIRAWVGERAIGCHPGEEPALVVDLRRRLAR